MLVALFQRLVRGPRVSRQFKYTELLHKDRDDNEPVDGAIEREFLIWETAVGTGRWRVRYQDTEIRYDDTNTSSEDIQPSQEYPQSRNAGEKGLSPEDILVLLKPDMLRGDWNHLKKQLAKKPRWPAQDAGAAKTPAPV